MFHNLFCSCRPIGFVLLTTSLLGCSTAESLPTVSGVVTTDGVPVRAGTITFYPDQTKGNATPHQPTGIIDSDGRYELYLPKGRKGAPAGWYKVVVYAVDNPQSNKPNRYLTHTMYADLKRTPLRIDVVPDPAPGRYDLTLKK